MRSEEERVRSIVGVMNPVSEGKIGNRRCWEHNFNHNNLQWAYQQQADSSLAQNKQAVAGKTTEHG
eukprot:14657886-Heterocapsa_arctica.AAC.1